MEQRPGGRSCESAEDNQTSDVWPSGIHTLEGPRRERGMIERSNLSESKWGLCHQECGRTDSRARGNAPGTGRCPMAPSPERASPRRRPSHALSGLTTDVDSSLSRGVAPG